MSHPSANRNPVVIFCIGLCATILFGLSAGSIYNMFPGFDEFAKSVGPSSGPSGAFEFSILLSGPIYFVFYAAFVVFLFLLVVSPVVAGAFFGLKAARIKKQSNSIKNEPPHA